MLDAQAVPTIDVQPLDAGVVAVQPLDDAPGDAQLVESDLLDEDVSIDGMCGVY